LTRRKGSFKQGQGRLEGRCGRSLLSQKVDQKSHVGRTTDGFESRDKKKKKEDEKKSEARGGRVKSKMQQSSGHP